MTRPSFLSDERGTGITETIIVLPILIWAYVGLYAFWDAYRSVNEFQKASYTIADIVSRENEISCSLLNGLDELAEYLISTGEPVEIRLTQVIWSEARKRFEVEEWSRLSGSSRPRLTTATLQPFASRIPRMSDGETVVLMEAWSDYVPPFEPVVAGIAGPQAQEMRQFIPTRPRFFSRTTMTCG